MKNALGIEALHLAQVMHPLGWIQRLARIEAVPALAADGGDQANLLPIAQRGRTDGQDAGGFADGQITARLLHMRFTDRDTQRNSCAGVRAKSSENCPLEEICNLIEPRLRPQPTARSVYAVLGFGLSCQCKG